MIFPVHIKFMARRISFARLFRKAFALSAITLIAISVFSPAFLLLPADAYAQITLVWDPPLDVDPPAGYIIYYGTEPQNYFFWNDVGNPAGDVKKYTFTGLDLTQPHFFAVRAYAFIGNFKEFSGLSKEAIYDARSIDASIGFFRRSEPERNWYFDSNGDGLLGECGTDSCGGPFGGLPDDIPVVGDWTRDGKNKIGIFRKGTWYLDLNGNGQWDGCEIDGCLGPFGDYDFDLPVAGDWNGDGLTKVGIYRQGMWYLDKNGNGSWDGCGTDACLGPFGGESNDIPVVGDWKGDGIIRVGIFRAGTWYLDMNGNGQWDDCGTDKCIENAGWDPDGFPVVGKWNGDDIISKLGIYRDGNWYLDWNGNGILEGCIIDRCVAPFGDSGDIPIILPIIP